MPETGLTAQVRRMYEQGAVPVREIARLAGVTERTIYKYAQKHDWAPRYAWPGGGRPRGRWRRWRAAEDALAPVKGAGGRFVPREARGEAVARGLKATDPQGAARAAAALERVQPVADEAWRAAERERRLNARVDALDGLHKAVRELAAFRAERARREPLPNDGAFELALCGVATAWTDTLRRMREADAADPV